MNKSLAVFLTVTFICLLFLSVGTSSKATQVSQTAYSPEEYVPNEVIVKFKEDVVGDLIQNNWNVRNVLDSAQGRIKSYLNHEINLLDWDPAKFTDRSFIGDPYLFLIRIPESISVNDAIALLQSDPRIEYAEKNGIYHASFLPQRFPNDFYNYNLWGLSKILAPEAWYQFTGSSTIVVAVLDSGTDLSHEDLAANLWTNPNDSTIDGNDNDNNGFIDDIHGWNFVSGNNDPTDDDATVYHGTHVSGIIGAVGNNNQIGISGVCWNVKIMPVKVCNSIGTWTDSWVVNGIDYATKNGAFLTNNSYGIKTDQPSESIHAAILRALSRNRLFITAAGEDPVQGYNEDQTNFHWYPADYTLDNIITVLATDQNDLVPFWSCWGPTSVDIGAPGYAIYSTIPGNLYQTRGGTSCAAPHVAGVAALALGICPGLTSSKLKTMILDGSDKVLSQDKCVSGGRLNAYNVLNAIGGTTPPNAPSNLSAYPTAWNIILLDWHDNSNNEVGFDIQKKDQYQSVFIHDNCVDSKSTSIVSFQDSAIDPSLGRTYTYQVRAANKVGISSFSNTASASVPYTLPAAPTDLECLSAVYPNVRLIWSDMANNERFFYLERRISGTGPWSVRATLPYNSTAYTDSQVQRGVTYDYRVRANNPLGYSAYSNVVTAQVIDW